MGDYGYEYIPEGPFVNTYVYMSKCTGPYAYMSASKQVSHLRSCKLMYRSVCSTRGAVGMHLVKCEPALNMCGQYLNHMCARAGMCTRVADVQVDAGSILPHFKLQGEQ